MLKGVSIRDAIPADQAGLEAVYADAFPDEDLIFVVQQLLDFGPQVVSLVAVKDDAVVGHVIFSPCEVDGEPVSLLAPLCAVPILHKHGIGTALVKAGLDRLKAGGIGHVYVLGNPNYYGRFGFKAEYGVVPPYPLPPKWQELGAWQSIALNGELAPQGKLQVPQPWQHSKYWSED